MFGYILYSGYFKKREGGGGGGGGGENKTVVLKLAIIFNSNQII